VVKAIAFLTDAQRAAMPAHAAKWINIGLSTEPMDLARWEPAARACYRYANLDEPRVVVPVSSPIVLALAAPIASAILTRFTPTGRLKKKYQVRDAVEGAVRGAVRDAVGGAVGGAVEGAVEDAVGGAVGGAVRDAVEGAVGGAVEGAVGGAVRDAVEGAVRDAVEGAVGGAVGDAVGGAVEDAVGGAVRDAVRDLPASDLKAAIARAWPYIIGGQFWVGMGWWRWWGSPASVSFLQDECGLALPGDLGDRARAYQETASSACWWWPHRRFVMVSDRPLRISRDERGRLHSEDGPAVVWRDGWGVYAWHGVRVSANVIETPAEKISAKWIREEPNLEVRRVLIERIGTERYIEISGAREVHRDDWGVLYVASRKGESDYAAVRVVNSSPEPDGSYREFWLRVPGKGAAQPPRHCVCCADDIAVAPTTAKGAIAWTFSLCPDDYNPVAMS
jgi:hypothetical protein